MSKASKSEKTLITTYLNETEKVLRDVLPSDEKDEVIKKIRDRWAFLNVKSTFDEFQKTYKLKSLEPSEVFEVKRFMSEVFPEEKVEITPDPKAGSLKVTVEMEQGEISGEFIVEPQEEVEEKPKFVPYLVCLSGDPGNAWTLAKAETLSEGEARIALNSLEEDFWLSKKGLKLLKFKKRSFDAFIEDVPASMLKSKGLKRHYKEPCVIAAVDAENSR